MIKETKWYTLTTKETLSSLETSEAGLTNSEAQKRLDEFGPNELQEEKRVNRLNLFLRQIKNPLVGVLIVAALISLFVNHLIDAVVIFIIIILNAIIGYVQEAKAEAAIQALKSLTEPEADVLRDCSQGVCFESRIKTKEIVPGDIILLEAGDKIPADSRVFEAFNLEVNESMLTGESAPTRKITEKLGDDLPVSEKKNMIFSGTVVTQGRGKAIVVSTGMKTEMGKIATLIRETEKVQTPIQKQTSDLSKKLGLFAIITSSIILVISLLRGFEFFEAFLFVLASAVSAIPEGLPIVITITLAIGVNRMAKRNAVIRNLQAVDTLGSATVICSDKTGTLTTNQMTLQKLIFDNKSIDVSGAGFSPKGQFKSQDKIIDPSKESRLNFLLKVGALCNNSKLRSHSIEGKTRWEISGDPTEGALVVAAAKAGINKELLEEEYTLIDEIPFDPKQRYMATFHKFSNQKILICTKGAPEKILAMCTDIEQNGLLKPLTRLNMIDVMEQNKQMASSALRVLAIAYKIIDFSKLEETKTSIYDGYSEMVFIGLVGMIDPPRPEATEAVQLCRRAGIRVIMATGDYKLTATAVAKQIGITKTEETALTGTELDQISDEELDNVVQFVSVYARVAPEQKYRLVEALRRNGQVVAMTGDGVNDAPALKAAEIGVAMGITGTDVTKETADMVLTDDNFASIVNAVTEGRVVFENIRKVVKYLISTNTGEIMTILAALIFLPTAPLIFTPIQILWVNLVTDGLVDKFLAMEPQEEDVMDHPPRNIKDRIINRDIILNVIFVGVFMATGTLVAFIYGWTNYGLIRAQTMAFVTISLFQLFNALNCRSRTKSVFKIGIFTNKYLIIGILTSVTLQILVTTLPPLQIVLGTTTLSVTDWLLAVLISSSVFVADEIRKLITNKTKRKHKRKAKQSDSN